MDAKSNPKVIPQTLRDLILEEIERDRQLNSPPVTNPNDYEVYPEEDNYDLPRNPYSRV